MYMDGNCKVFLLRFNRGLQVIHESRIIISNWLRYKFYVGISKILIESIGNFNLINKYLLSQLARKVHIHIFESIV